MPDGVPELVLAKASAEPGQSVHSIGNPGGSGALWVYTPGKVRQVYPKKWTAKLGAQDGRLPGDRRRDRFRDHIRATAAARSWTTRANSSASPRGRR